MRKEVMQGRGQAMEGLTREFEAIQRQFREHDRMQALAPLTSGRGLVGGSDSDALLSAVSARLRLIVGEPRGSVSDGLMDAAMAQIQASVLECAAALDHLHASSRHHAGQQAQADQFATGGAETSAANAESARARGRSAKA